MKPKMRGPQWLALAGCLLVTGCSMDPLAFRAPAGHGLETLTQRVGPDAPTLTFAFELDDTADASKGEIGTGYIVVSRDDQEIQALPHAFEMPRDRLDGKAWLDFRDFNGDGLMDFKVTRLFALDGRLAIDSLYQFDARTGKFAPVDTLSNAGEMAVSAPGCVSLKVLNAAGAVKLESHCFSPSAGKWTRSKPYAAQKDPVAARADAVCEPTQPELVSCRRARIEQDRVLLTVVRENRLGKKQALAGTQGQGYAEAYARTQDLDHQSWRRHRDARCAAEARERGVDVKALPAVTELCRYDWSRDQLRRYRDQMARLGDGKLKP